MLTLIQKLAHLCLKPLIALFDFPIVPAELTTLVNKLFEYIQAGTGILNFFVPFDVIRPAIDVFLAVWAVEHAYQLVLWVLRKVPILGIFLSTLSLRRATAKVHKTVGHFCAYETNFMGIASSC